MLRSGDVAHVYLRRCFATPTESQVTDITQLHYEADTKACLHRFRCALATLQMQHLFPTARCGSCPLRQGRSGWQRRLTWRTMGRLTGLPPQQRCRGSPGRGVFRGHRRRYPIYWRNGLLQCLARFSPFSGAQACFPIKRRFDRTSQLH